MRRRGRAGRTRLAALVVGVLLASGAVHGEADTPDESPDDCVGELCPSDAIYQFAPSAAFAASLFDGPTRFADVLRLGDFGLGATSPLEGEVIVVDGTAWHAGPTGELEILSPTARTPFAFVKHFRPERRVELPPVGGIDDLARALDRTLPSRNLFYATRIDGTFDFLELRSVPLQSRPYASLAKVIEGQNVFTATQIEGTLVGFRFPGYLGGVNAPGWHFHFVDEARRLGGHVLEVRAAPLTAALDQSRTLTLVVPDDPAFEAAELDDPGGAAAFGAAIRPDPAASGAAAPAPPAP